MANIEPYTSLFKAVSEGDLKKVKLLFNYKSCSSDEWSTSQKYELLLTALQKNHRHVSIYLVKNLCPVNIKDSKGETPLHIALEKKDLEIIRLLLSKNANIRAKNDKNRTPVQIAIFQDNVSVIALFLKYVSVPELNSYRILPYFAAKGYESIVKLCLSYGADVNVQNEIGQTALCSAVEKGHVNIALLLLNEKASVSLDLSNGITPLTIAIKKKNTEMVGLLLKTGASVQMKYGDPLHIAVYKKYWEHNIFAQLVSHGADINLKSSNGSTPLHVAVQSGSYDAITCLLQHNADVNVQDCNGQTPLHIAVAHGTFGIAKILQNGARVNFHDKMGKAPIHIAVEKKNMSAMKYLLEYRADIHAKTEDDNEPLHIAVRDGNILFTNLLIEYKANVNAVNKFGITPLHIAVETENVTMVENLLHSNANVNSKIASGAQEGSSPLMLAVQKLNQKIIQKLLDSKANIDDEDKNGKTVLHIAVENKNVNIINLILKNKPSVESKGNRKSLGAAIMECNENELQIVDLLIAYGFTLNAEEAYNSELLDCAMRKGFVNVIEQLPSLDCENLNASEVKTKALCNAIQNHNHEIVYNLIKYGADCKAPDDQQKSPLYYAVTTCNYRAAKLLLENNAFITSESELLFIAIKNHMNEILDLLLEHGADINTRDIDDHRSLLYHAVTTSNVDAVQLLFKKGVSITNETELLFKSNVIAHDKNLILKLFLECGADINARDGSQQSLLYHAVTSRNKEAVQLLLKKKPSIINLPNLLHIAISNKSITIFKLLLECAPDINVRNSSQHSLLYHAVTSKNEKVVRLLLKKNVSLSNEPDLLHTAIINRSNTILKLLVEYGIDIKAPNSSQNSLMYNAVEFCNDEAVLLLLEKKVSISNEPNLLHMAVRHCRYSEIVKYLIEYGADINALDDSGKSLMYNAVMARNERAVELLLREKVSISNEPDLLLLAIIYANDSIVNLLIEHGADVNARDSSQKSLMYHAVAKRKDGAVGLLFEKNPSISFEPDLLHEAIRNNSNSIVKLLLKHGADVNVRDSSQNSAMHTAVEASNATAVELLFEEKMSLTNEPDLLCCAVRRLCEPVVNVLLDKGFDINRLNKEGVAPLHEAISRNSPKMVSFLLERGALLRTRTKDGKTCLHIAAKESSLDVVKMVMGHGVDTGAVDFSGNTVFHTIADVRYRQHNAAWILEHRKNSRKLINTKNQRGDTPLLIAARAGNAVLIDLFIKSGADIECKDSYGKSVLHLAYYNRSSTRSMEIVLDYHPFLEERINGRTIFDVAMENPRVNNLMRNKLLFYCLKRKYANLFQSKSEKCFLNTFEQRAPPNPAFEKMCREELERLKTLNIGQSNVTYYSLLQKNTMQVATLCKKRTVGKADDTNYRKVFPMYGDMIQGRLMYGRQRSQLLDKMNKHANDLFPLLPFYCIQHVIAYLSNADLCQLLSLF